LKEAFRLRVLGNRELRKVFEPERDELTGKRRRLNVEGLHYLYSSPDFIGVLKPRRMLWLWHVARMGRREVHTGFWWVNLRKRKHLGYLGLNERIILKCIFKKLDEGVD
jgi:hypothetical protein